jgi:hypothetical protein
MVEDFLHFERASSESLRITDVNIEGHVRHHIAGTLIGNLIYESLVHHYCICICDDGYVGSL